MTLLDDQVRRFDPGTTGWSEADLDSEEFAGEWAKGRYEIINGVLTKMAPAMLDGGFFLGRLGRMIAVHLDAKGIEAEVAVEIDLVIDAQRVLRVDAALITPAVLAKQRAARKRGEKARHGGFGRLRVPPDLIIECVSPGHEAHDRETKRQWYAEFNVPSYWILDPYGKRLDCLTLAGSRYVEDCAGGKKGSITPAALPGLKISMEELWKL